MGPHLSWISRKSRAATAPLQSHDASPRLTNLNIAEIDELFALMEDEMRKEPFTLRRHLLSVMRLNCASP